MIGLADASVALDGGIIAAGQLRYTADPARKFPPCAPADVHLARGAWMDLRPVDAPRDDATGFCRVARLGAVLRLPAEIAVAIDHALRFGVKQPQALSLAYEAGWLASGDGRDRFVQALSDWQAALVDEAGDVTVRLSAAPACDAAARRQGRTRLVVLRRRACARRSDLHGRRGHADRLFRRLCPRAGGARGRRAPHRSIIAARLDCTVDARGLTIAYALTTAILGYAASPTPVEGSFTLGWELLILRFPRFAALTPSR